MLTHPVHQRRALASSRLWERPAPAYRRGAYLFEDRFSPGRGNEKGKVEGLVGYARRNFLVPIVTMRSTPTCPAGETVRGHE